MELCSMCHRFRNTLCFWVASTTWTSINSQLIPALTGQNPTGDLVHQLLALPTHLGGLGLINPVDASAEQHHTSKLISTPLVNRVVNLELTLGECHATQQLQCTKDSCSIWEEVQTERRCWRSAKATPSCLTEVHGALPRERSINMADSCAHRPSQLCSSQVCF